MHQEPASTQPVVTRITINLFTSLDGRLGHWITVEGEHHPVQAMRLAIRALRERLRRRIW